MSCVTWQPSTRTKTIWKTENLQFQRPSSCLQIRRLLSDRAAPPSTKEAKIGIKLPKMNVPTFDGNWQQSDVAIHTEAQLEDTKILTYLRDVLKDGASKTRHWELNSWCRVLQRIHWLSPKVLQSTARDTLSSYPCNSRCSLLEGWQ